MKQDHKTQAMLADDLRKRRDKLLIQDLKSIILIVLVEAAVIAGVLAWFIYA